MELTPTSIARGLVGAILLVLLALVAIVAVPQAVGADDAYIVTSDSMTPAIESGDVVIVEDVGAESIEEGDVITFHHDDAAESGYVTHRVVGVHEEDGETYFETKGDANEQSDQGLVPAEYVRGKMTLHVPYLGHLLLFARSGTGTLLLVIVPAIGLVGMGLWQLLDEFGYASAIGQSLDSSRGAEAASAGTDEITSEEGDQ